MRGVRSFSFAHLVRAITLRPDATVDPERYPLGYVPLDGSEPLDSVWSLVKSGVFVAPLSKIETIHRAHVGVRHLARSEYAALSSIDIIGLHARLQELCSRLLIRRDFWLLDDYNDPELNSSFGVQNVYFDNFKWSQVLWRRFQQYVEEYFPVSEHTHLTYDEYLQLLRSFSHFEQGARLAPLLPKRYKIHPPFGVCALSMIDLEPLLLYSNWLKNFRRPLMLCSALVVRSGCGAAAFATKLNGVPIVRGVDPNPRAVMSCRKDAQRMGRLFDAISFRVGDMFPIVDEAKKTSVRRKYDLIFFYPDQGCYNLFFNDIAGEYAPVLTGFAGALEYFFEEAERHLSDAGVIVLCCTNLCSILKPNKVNPIEYEIKVNRRWVLLDYYDVPVRRRGTLCHTPAEYRYRIPEEVRRHMRSELWVLHKITSIANFAHIHNIPGAAPPSCVMSSWRNKTICKLRRAALREHVESIGGDWDDYKKRLTYLLREQSDMDEDDKAQAIRMAMDPDYPNELAGRARAAIEKNMNDDQTFHNTVAQVFGNASPRACFDSCHLS